MGDFISREAALACVCQDCSERMNCISPCVDYCRINDIPAADVVARDCYDRILSENDTMRKQLAQIGKKPGDRMDDVRTVVKGTWEKDNSYPGPGLMNVKCSVCGNFGGTWRENTFPSMFYKFCPTCGADCRGGNDGK